MILAYDTNLNRVDSNIFHATKDIQYPPLFKLLLDTKAYFELNSDIASVNSFYIIFKTVLDDFDRSYNFDIPTFTELVNINVELISIIDSQHLLVTDLTFLKLSMKYRVNSVMLRNKLDYQLLLFSQNKEPTFNLEEAIKNKTMNKESLSIAIFMQPVIINNIKDREYYISIINTVEAGEELYPLKQDIINSITNFYSTTNADLIILMIQLLQNVISPIQDEYIASKFEVMLLMNNDITDTGKSETADNKLLIMNSMVSLELTNVIVTNSQTSSYVVNNSAQNLPVRNEQLAEEVILMNVSMESKSNTSIIADNTNQIVLSMKNNNLIIAEENTKLEIATTQLNTSNQILTNESVLINADANYVVNEQLMVIERGNIDNSTQQITVSTTIIKTTSLKQNILMENYKEVSKQNKEADSTLVIPLKLLNLEASNTMTNTNLVMGMAKDQTILTTTSMDNSLLSLGLITTALVDTNYPNRSIETGFSLLKTPLQLVLTVVNGLVCMLEALQCIAVGLALGIIELAVFLTDLATAQSDFENLDTDFLIMVENLKNSIVDEYNSAMLASNLSAIMEVAKSQLAEVEDLLLGDASMIVDYEPAIKEACLEWGSTISQTIMDQITDEFVLFVDELKSAMQQTIDNMLGLLNVSECEAINFDLPEFGGINMFEITFPDLKFPDFKIDIPRAELKVKPC